MTTEMLSTSTQFITSAEFIIDILQNSHGCVIQDFPDQDRSIIIDDSVKNFPGYWNAYAARGPISSASYRAVLLFKKALPLYKRIMKIMLVIILSPSLLLPLMYHPKVLSGRSHFLKGYEIIKFTTLGTYAKTQECDEWCKSCLQDYIKNHNSKEIKVFIHNMIEYEELHSEHFKMILNTPPYRHITCLTYNEVLKSNMDRKNAKFLKKFFKIYLQKNSSKSLYDVGDKQLSIKRICSDLFAKRSKTCLRPMVENLVRSDPPYRKLLSIVDFTKLCVPLRGSR